MITNFENKTKDLSDSEKSFIPVIIDVLEKHSSVSQPLTSRKVCEFVNSRIVENIRKDFPSDLFDIVISQDFEKKKLSDVRLRKIINHIRLNRIKDGLCANEKGYFITDDVEEIRKQIQSLKERSEAIFQVMMSFQEFRTQLIRRNQIGSI